MNDGELRCAVGVAYTAPITGGIVRLLETVRDFGATLIGAGGPEVPIAIALETPELFGLVKQAWVSSEHGWTATLELAPHTGLSLAWPAARGGTRTAVNAFFERLLELGAIDFAAWDEVLVSPNARNPPRREYLAYFDASSYASLGPVTLGARTLFGPRVVGLLEPPLRTALIASGSEGARGLTVGGEHWLTTEAGRRERAALSEAFEASGIVRRLRVDFTGYTMPSSGPGWVALPPGPGPAALPRKAAAAVKKLLVGAEELEVPGLVAPFALLGGIELLDVDLEGAKLPFASFSSSVLRDVSLIGADLRGVDAPRSEWLEANLDDADLRWANFRDARFPLSSLERVNARGACFAAAEFLDVHLEGAVFDGADLTGAVFTEASLRGASFCGAVLTGVTFTRCILDGAEFDSRAAPEVS